VHLEGVEEMTDNELADLLEAVNEETGRCSIRIFDHAKVLIRKLEERRVWQYLTDDEIKEIVGGYGNEGGIGGYTRELFNKIQAKIREKNESKKTQASSSN
jgi:predicted house-cleaning NTP pyrophosphatase (Maf/HAM1 superfamily)